MVNDIKIKKEEFIANQKTNSYCKDCNYEFTRV